MWLHVWCWGGWSDLSLRTATSGQALTSGVLEKTNALPKSHLMFCFFLTISPFHTNMMELIAKDQHADIVKNRLKMLLVETDCLHCPSCNSYRAKHNTTALQPCIWKRHFPNNINLKKKKVWGAKSYVNILWSKSFFFFNNFILFWTNN